MPLASSNSPTLSPAPGDDVPTPAVERPDAVDIASGISPQSPLFEVRAFRPEFVKGAQACRQAVIEPDDDLGLSYELRSAIALRSARHNANAALIARYQADCDRHILNSNLKALALGQAPSDLPEVLAAVARHTDMICFEPGQARAAHLEDLLAVGLSVPQIVALSELLAFINFESRVVNGLTLLEAVS